METLAIHHVADHSSSAEIDTPRMDQNISPEWPGIKQLDPPSIVKVMKDNIAITCSSLIKILQLMGDTCKYEDSKQAENGLISIMVQFNDFFKDLKLVEDCYNNLYMETKAIITFGASENLIPHIKMLIKREDQLAAIEEINSFFGILKRRTKDVLDKLDDHEKEIRQLIKEYEKCKEQLEAQVEKEKKVTVICPGRIGSTWYNSFSFGFVNDYHVPKKLGMRDIFPIDNLKNYTQNVFEHFHIFSRQILKLQSIITNTDHEELAKLQCHELQNGEVNVNGFENIADILQEMFEMFKELEKEIRNKELVSLAGD